MTRFSFVFLFIAMSALNSLLLNPAVAAAAAVTDIQLDPTEPQASTSDEVGCGESSADVTERIVGGEEAVPHSWPWQVQFRYKQGDGYYTCGGSLVANNWVVTAAHCVVNITEGLVFLGKHYSLDYGKDEPDQGVARIGKYFVHEKYDELRLNLGFDIALLKLEQSLVYGKNIKPICLPFDLPELKSTSVCYATGWGTNDPNKTTTVETLKQLKTPIQHDYSYCGTGMAAAERNICAGSKDRRDNICYGDSGGPLACKETDGKWFLRGVSSYGPDKQCNSVALFTKVTAFRDWITEKIEKN